METEIVRQVGHALEYARARRRVSVSDLQELVRIPSVSAQPQHAADVRRCAVWLAAYLRRIGVPRVEVIATPRHPIVWAEWRGAPRRPTVLIYGHYDVQPVDPLAAWRSPPFAAAVRGGYLYGRGASDDKGQLFAHLKAMEAYLHSGGLPVNVVVLLDGEEEIGSPHLLSFLRAHASRLRADVAVISDTRMLAADQPAITFALRGSLSLEVEVRGPARDLHSGAFGGAVHNPLQALAGLIAGLHDAQGRIAIPGFYAQVRKVSDAERRSMACAGPSDRSILLDAGVAAPWGEVGYSLYERTTIRPAFTVNGLTGGYQGEGGKSVIPARASAKLSVRLVPDQDPGEVEALVRRYIARWTPPGMRTVVRTQAGTPPVEIERGHPAMRAAALAYREGFDRLPRFVRSGGTIPVVDLLRHVLGISTVLMGFGLPDDRTHAPNERFLLANYARGIATSLHFLAQLGEPWPLRAATGAGHAAHVARRTQSAVEVT